MTEWEYASTSRWFEIPACPECKSAERVKMTMPPSSQAYGNYDCHACRLTFSAAPKDWVKRWMRP